MSKRLLPLLVLAAFGAAAHAKLPAPVLDDAAKAKAEEAKARAGWQAKVDAYQLCKAQDRVVAKYKGGGGAAAGKDAKAMPVAANKPGAGAPAPGTPVTAAGAAPCVDPGPFAYNPPEQKPLETAGAHSPTATSGSPPNVRPESAQMAPAKPSTAPSGGAPAKK